MQFALSRRQFLAHTVAAAALPLSGAASTGPHAVAIAGYGRRGQWHAAHITRGEGVRLAAICDPRPQPAGQSVNAAILGWREILQDRQIASVLIAAPEAARADLIVEALDAGKHVVSETPFAMTESDGHRIGEATARSGADLRPVCHSPLHPFLPLAAECVHSGSIGGVYRVQSHLPVAAFPWGTGGARSAWRRDGAHCLGPAAEALHHQLTTVQPLISLRSATLISVAGGNSEGSSAVPDAVLAEFQAGDVQCVMSASPYSSEAYLHLRGCRGELLIEPTGVRIRGNGGAWMPLRDPRYDTDMTGSAESVAQVNALVLATVVNLSLHRSTV